MNITFVTTHLTVLVGGGKFLAEYANKLCERGHNISIVAQKFNHELYKFNPGVSIIEVGGALPKNPLHWLLFNRIGASFMSALRPLQSDLLVSHRFPANIFCMQSKKNKMPKHVFLCLEPFRYFHDMKFRSGAPFSLKIVYFILSFFFKKLDIKGARAADEIICISNFVKKKIREVYNRESQVHLIGIEINRHREQPLNFNFTKTIGLNDNNLPIVFTLGLSHHLKGERELMLIFSKIVKEIPNAILLVGGWKTKENEIRMRRIEMKLNIPKENIIFYGFIEPKLLDLFYQNATITVYTAIDESYGYIPLESMKNGAPVVAFEGGPSDTIIDGQTGYIIKNVDLDEFAQKSIILLQNKTLRKQFSENAKQHIKINFDLEKSSLRLEESFKEIISTKSN